MIRLGNILTCMAHALRDAHEEGDRDGQERERAGVDDVSNRFDTVIDNLNTFGAI